MRYISLSGNSRILSGWLTNPIHLSTSRLVGLISLFMWLLSATSSVKSQDLSPVIFSYNGTDGSDGSAQTYTVPNGIFSLSIVAYGAEGRNGDSFAGGKGGKVEAFLKVTPGQILIIYVGGRPSEGGKGFNGGGQGAVLGFTRGGGGGGATDIRLNGSTLGNRIIVAGGGGGGGLSRWTANGGNGGGLIGETGRGHYSNGGNGGTQAAGGAGGAGTIKEGIPGALGSGGDGFIATGPYATGGGGGGYYGGGSGGDQVDNQGHGGITGAGGGGSSYANSVYTTKVTHAQGVRSGHGEVTIMPIPTLSLIASTTILTCYIPSATLTASGGSVYSWNTGDRTPAITVTTPGTYSVTITASNGYSETHSQIIGSDNAPPAGIILSSNAILDCKTNSAIITATQVPGVTYTFSAGATQTGNSNVATVTKPGTYSVVVTGANGCKATASVEVHENKTPPIVNLTSSGVITCRNSSAILAATPTAGATYTFSNGASQVGDGNTAIVTEGGEYSVVVTGANGCEASTSVNVDEDKDVPAVSLSRSGVITCENRSISLNATLISGATYDFSKGAMESGDGNTATVTEAGMYSVLVTGTNGCTTAASIYVPGISGTAEVDQPVDQSICPGVTSPILFSGDANTFVWTNTNPDIGLPSSGISSTGVLSFNALNPTHDTKTGSVSVTPLKVPVIYVANAATNTLDFVNTLTNSVTASVPVGNYPLGVSVSPDGNRVYVANNLSNTVSVVNTSTRSVIADIPISPGPKATLLSPEGKHLYVTSQVTGRLTVINTLTNAVLSEIPVGNMPEGMAISSDGNTLYLALRNNDRVAVVNTTTNAITANIEVGSGPSNVALSPDGSTLYISNASWGTVSVVNTATNTVRGTVSVGSLPMGIAASEDGEQVYVANYGSGTVSVIATSDNTMIKTLSLGGNPGHIKSSIDGSLVYVLNASGSISVLEGTSHSVLNTIPIEGSLSASADFVSLAGCTGETKSFMLSVHGSPVVEFNSNDPLSCTNPVVTLTATLLPGAHYKFEEGATQVDGSNIATVTQPGTYSVLITTADGCELKYTCEVTGVASTPGNIIYVKQGGSGTGASWDCGLGDLQTAINLSATGNEIRVAAGTYQPTSGQSFSMKEGVEIYGGFPADGAPGIEKRDWATHATTLEGNGSSVIVNDNNGLTRAALLDGFVIKGGSAAGGGGIYNKSVSPTFKNLILKENTASDKGGAIWNHNASPVVINTLIFGNSAGYGAAVFNEQGSRPEFIHCTISGNNAINGACGGINTGGRDSKAFFTNTIVWYNTFNLLINSTSNIRNEAEGTAEFAHSLVQGSGGSDNWIPDFGNNSGRNLDEDPLFAQSTEGRYDLQGCSPAINSGVSVGDIAFDLAGNNRLYGNISDIGTYEYQLNVPTGVERLAANGNTATINIEGGKSYAVLSTQDVCRAMVKIESKGLFPLTGEVIVAAWIDHEVNTYNGAPYVQRYYDISPATNASNATANVTLYFTQEEFGAFNNELSSGPLPVNSDDASGKSNLRVFQFHGNAEAGNSPSSYTGSLTTIDPADEDIVWNERLQRWEVSFDVTGFSGFFVGSASSPLPVKLVGFEGNLTDAETVELRWRVTEQVDIASYEVQYSPEGRNFVTVGSVVANHFEHTTYQFEDDRRSGPVAYYRLRMVEQDGSNALSRIISVAVSASGEAIVYPVPATDYLWIESMGLKNSEIKLIDLQGRALRTIRVQSDRQPIAISDFPPGVYFISLPYGNTLKWIKD